MNQGVYGNQFMGFNLSNNDGSKTSFFNVNLSNNNNYNQIINDRFLKNSILNQSSYSTTPANNASIGFGIGRELTKNWQFNYDGKLIYSINNSETRTQSLNRNLMAELISENVNNTTNKRDNLNVSQGISTNYKLDTLGSEWTTDFSYNYLENKSNQDYLTAFILPKLNDILGNGNVANKRHFFTAQVDLKYKLPHQITFESGFKIAIQNFKSETQYFISNQKDNFRTNTYNFNDKISAFYVQGSKKMGEFILKIDSRFEKTDMEGRQIVPRDTAFKINRTDIFHWIIWGIKF